MKRLVLLTFALLLGVFNAYGAPTVGATAATPASITVGQAATLTVTSSITDSTLLTAGINLIRINANGSQTILTTLHDDGLSGDAVANDKIFSAQVSFNEVAAGQIQLQVSAAFKGVLKRSLSNIVIVNVVAGAPNLPTITATLSPVPNANGWNNSDVTVTFHCSDNVGISTCSPPVTVTTEGVNQLSGTVRNTGGVTATTSVTVKLDKTPPVITATSSPAANAAGWNNTNTTVNFNCTDSVSGIGSCPAAVVVSAEGVDQINSANAQDLAGNVANTSKIVRVDKTPPVLTVTSPLDGANVFSTQTSVAGTFSDTLSGTGGVTCNGVVAQLGGSGFSCDVSVGTGTSTITVQASDAAGNTVSSTRRVAFVPAPVVTVTSPANLSFTNITPVTLRGTVSDSNATVTVNGLAAFVSGGTFNVQMPLIEGTNTLTAVAKNAGGNQATASIVVTLDTTPPHVSVTTPANNSTTTDSSISVSGIVNDIVVGTVNNQEAQVTVNGISAPVSNRSFSAANVPLNLGANTIQIVARDRVGNGVTTNIVVTRVASNSPPLPTIGDSLFNDSLTRLNGNHQSGAIATRLAQPLVVSLTDAGGNPRPNQTVVFHVSGGNGTLSNGGAQSASLIATTNASGQAQALWTLGTRAGSGINSVQASSLSAISPVTFTADALYGAPSAIVVDSGDAQTGPTGQALTFPLVAVVIDAGHNRVSSIPVTFTVLQGGGNLAGTQSRAFTTDSDGRVQAVLTLGGTEGPNSQIVQATFANNPGPAISFIASSKVPGDPAKTTISGIVLDNANTPLQQVSMRLYQTNQGPNNALPKQIGSVVTTGIDGKFLIPGAPVGFYKLMADGNTVAGTKAYPTVEYDIVTVAGQDNTVGTPIYLPVLDQVNKVCVDETHGGTLTLPQSPGFSLTVAAGTATFPGGARSGCVTVSTVHGDKIPMTPGFGQQPRFIVSIQPVGTLFNPPAAIAFPNVDGLKPREKTEMYSYDHDLSMFVAIGTGTVSDDGSLVASDPGVGVLKAGWHCGGNPQGSGHVADCGTCKTCQGGNCVPSPGGSGCNDTKPSFELNFNGGADKVHISLGPSCQGKCTGTSCGPSDNGFNMTPVMNALQSAMNKIFDNSGDACIETSLRQKIQNRLKNTGLVIACRPDDPGQQQLCADTISTDSNNMILRPSSFKSGGGCPNMDATLLHEIIHGPGGSTGSPSREYHNSALKADCRDQPYGCEESCFNGSTRGTGANGNPFACLLPPDELGTDPHSGCGPCQFINGVSVCLTN